ncbi:MAG: hypothetical protein ACM3SQ_12300 [Betaproteobacteria bacterium]
MRRMVLASALLLLGAGPGRATVLIPATLGDIARDARTIAVGRVIDVRPRWTPGRHTIETLVTLEVREYLKGPLGDTVEFLVPGGEMGRYRSIFVGAPTFAPDERVIVFLGARGPGIPYVLGLGQGVFRLIPAPDGSGWLVSPPAVLRSVGLATGIVRGDPERRPMPLGAFERRVRVLAGARP